MPKEELSYFDMTGGKDQSEVGRMAIQGGSRVVIPLGHHFWGQRPQKMVAKGGIQPGLAT
jgi:hypothetical protein